MLFRPADMVYAILAALISAGLAGETGAESAESVAHDRSDTPPTIRDVLGRNVIAPDARSWTGPLPVCFLYEVTSPAGRFAERIERQKEVIFELDSDFEKLRNGIDRDGLGDREAEARLDAMALAIELYRDPGPAFTLANDIMPWLPTDRSRANRNVWWFDTNLDGDLSSEVQTDANDQTLRIKTSTTVYAVARKAVLKEVAPLRTTSDRSRDKNSDRERPADKLPPTSTRPLLRTTAFGRNGDVWETPLNRFRDLLRLDSEARKTRLPEIIAAADSVLSSKPIERILSHDQMDYDPDWIAEASLLIAETLYRKGRALGYQELPDVIAKNPISDPAEHRIQFMETCDQLARVIREDGSSCVDAEDYGLLLVRRHRKERQYGQALMVLSEMTERVKPGSPADFWYTKKRRDLYGDLGWDTLREYEHHWLWRKFPAWTYALEYGTIN